MFHFSLTEIEYKMSRQSYNLIGYKMTKFFLAEIGIQFPLFVEIQEGRIQE